MRSAHGGHGMPSIHSNRAYWGEIVRTRYLGGLGHSRAYPSVCGRTPGSDVLGCAKAYFLTVAQRCRTGTLNYVASDLGSHRADAPVMFTAACFGLAASSSRMRGEIGGRSRRKVPGQDN